jgi:SAM-dependent methyltransferase
MTWDPVWDDVFSQAKWGSYPSEHLVRFMARTYRHADPSKIKVLEIGCGPGANVWYMAREGFLVTGLDGSPVAIEQAKQRFAQEGLNANLRVGDAGNLEDPDDTYDAVVDVECLCANSREAARGILREVRRVLKPGGKLFSQTFTDRMPVGQAAKKLGPGEYTDAVGWPFEGKGFIRLETLEGIRDLYGVLEVESVDEAEYSIGNGAHRVSEWLVICSKGKQPPAGA